MTDESVQSIATAARSSGTVNGAGVDCSGFEACAMSVRGVVMDDEVADTTLLVSLQDSDDGVDWSDVLRADVTSADKTVQLAKGRRFVEADAAVNPPIGIVPLVRTRWKKWLRAVGTVVGTGIVRYGVSLRLYHAG